MCGHRIMPCDGNFLSPSRLSVIDSRKLTGDFEVILLSSPRFAPAVHLSFKGSLCLLYPRKR